MRDQNEEQGFIPGFIRDELGFIPAFNFSVQVIMIFLLLAALG